jgi:hypothetical protein
MLLNVFPEIWIVVPSIALGTILASMLLLVMIDTNLFSRKNTLAVGARNAVIFLIVTSLLNLQNQLIIAILATITMFFLVVQFLR